MTILFSCIYLSYFVICLQPEDLNVMVRVCLTRDIVPVYLDILLCENGYYGYMNNTPSQGQSSLKVIVPYPQAGMWVLGLMMHCYKPGKDNKR